MGLVVSLLFLLLFLVEVQCQQTFPYVSFMGKTLANHSYVDISVVGISASDSVQCRTNLVAALLRIPITDSGTSLMELHWKVVINLLSINIVYF